MKNIEFGGLEKILNKGYYIEIFHSNMGYLISKIKNKNKEVYEQEIKNINSTNIISTLCGISNLFMTDNKYKDENKIWFERTLIDNVLEQGYILYIFKLPNNLILTMICTNGYENDIPIKSVITDDIKSGFEALNETLRDYSLGISYDFDIFAEHQKDSLYKYQKKHIKNKINKKTT